LLAAASIFAMPVITVANILQDCHLFCQILP
jgi:hypothetical protein